MQKFTQLDDLEFLSNVDRFIKIAQSAGHLYIGYSYFSSGHAILNHKKGLIDYTLVHNWTLIAEPIFKFLQRNSHSCYLYGSSFEDDSFMGQALNAKKFLTRKGKVYVVDLKSDLWTACELFWGDVDPQKSPPYTGEIYFYMNNEQIDWVSLFKQTKNPSVLTNPRTGLGSITGYRNAHKYAKTHSSNIVVEFHNHALKIFAHPDIIGNLARLAMAFSAFDNANGYTFDTKTSRPILLGVTDLCS
jgi:hypothetical protein